jgi:hypothetical protein
VTSYHFSNIDDHRKAELTHCSVLYGEGWWCQLKEVRHLGQYAFDYQGETDVFPDLDELAENCSGVKMKIGSSSSNFTLFPKDQFTYQDAVDLAESHFFTKDEDAIGMDTIYNRAIMNLYLADRPVIAHNTAAKYHVLSPLLSFLSNEGDRVYAFLSFPGLTIIAYKGGQLIYATVKSISDQEEGLYYIMRAYQVAGLDPQIAPTFLGGRCLQDSPWYNLLYRFIANIQWVKTPGIDKDSHIFHDIYLLSRYF